MMPDNENLIANVYGWGGVADKLGQLTNEEIAQLLIDSFWDDKEMFTARNAIVAEAVSRLSTPEGE